MELKAVPKTPFQSTLKDALIISLNGKPEVVVQSIDEYEDQLELIAYYKYKQMVAEGVD